MEKDKKLDLNKKVALWTGIFILTFAGLILINDFFLEVLDFRQKNYISPYWTNWVLRFTYLTTHVNLFMGAALINIAINKKYKAFAGRLINFAMAYFLVTISLYWTIIHPELSGRFNEMNNEPGTPNWQKNERWNEYFHVVSTHLITPVIGFIGYVFVRKDLVMLKSDMYWSCIYIFVYWVAFVIMYLAKFVPAYQKTVGDYATKMNAGNQAVWNLYHFIKLANPMFMKNPDPQFPIWFLWTKAVIIDVLVFIGMMSASIFYMFILQRAFNIRTFNKQEYREFKAQLLTQMQTN